MRKLKTLEQLKTCMIEKHNINEIFGLLFPFGKETDDEDGFLPDIRNKPYTTHKPTGIIPGTSVNLKFKKNINEEEGDDEETYGIEVEETPPEEIDEPQDSAEIIPPQQGEFMGAMPEEEEKDPTELGRIYELKKIYSRLTALEGYLGDESNKQLIEIRKYVSQAIELFEVVSSNFNSYKDKLPNIIIMYYEFLKEVYNQVKEVYRKEVELGE